MTSPRVLSGGWQAELADLVASARHELIVCAPYITAFGVRSVTAHLSDRLRGGGQVVVVTDLSPVNVAASATDPLAVRDLARSAASTVYHLPRVHAKVYLADSAAIITSGNLTFGGLVGNYEYGVRLADPGGVREVRADIREYAALGGPVSGDVLDDLCDRAEQLRADFRACQSQVPRPLADRSRELIERAADELVRVRLSTDSLQGILVRTIHYLLRKHGPMRTADLHPYIQTIHPDLCDDSVDRVIDGKRFGKLWKHAVRSAQQQLKRDGVIEFDGAVWRLKGSEPPPPSDPV